MATSTGTPVFRTNTAGGEDAAFRAWGLALSQAFAAVGLIQTADTGQVNWTTVTTPAQGATTVYEIWRFNDALQATKPVFMKVAYGANGNSTNSTLFVSTGTGSNGTGTLTGVTTTQQTLSIGTSVAGVPGVYYASGDGGYVNMVIGNTGAAGTPFDWRCGLFIERSRSSNGANNGDGFIAAFVTATGANSAYQVVSFTNSAVSALQTSMPLVQSQRHTSYNTGTEVTVFPMVVVTPKPQGASLSILACGLNDFPRISMQSTIVSGASHSYIAITGANGARTPANDTVGLLMRYE